MCEGLIPQRRICRQSTWRTRSAGGEIGTMLAAGSPRSSRRVSPATSFIVATAVLIHNQVIHDRFVRQRRQPLLQIARHETREIGDGDARLELAELLAG